MNLLQKFETKGENLDLTIKHKPIIFLSVFPKYSSLSFPMSFSFLLYETLKIFPGLFLWFYIVSLFPSPKCSSFLSLQTRNTLFVISFRVWSSGGLKESGGSPQVFLWKNTTLDKIIERYLMSSDCDSMGESGSSGSGIVCSQRHSQGQITQKKTHGRALG